MKKVLLALVGSGLIMISFTSCKKECECSVKLPFEPAAFKLSAGELSKKDCENTKAVGGYTEVSGVTITCTSK